MSKTKPFEISKNLVMNAYYQVKQNKGSAGIDNQSIEDFDKNLKNNLYKIWNRMSSGCYFPPPVLVVEIPKSNGGIRKLGIPTVSDRIAQTVVKMALEPEVDPKFHPDSYGYRPNKSALDAVDTARKRCWKYEWVIDMDIKGFFDNIDHELMMRAVRKHTQEKWILLYIERWLKAPAQLKDGTILRRNLGTPQGGCISPLIANIFLHHAFDEWIRKTYPWISFERYADDIIVHCRTEAEAIQLKECIERRLSLCKLELHPEKTKIVYCKSSRRKENYSNISFDFLGYTFRPRSSVNRKGKRFTGFLPAISRNAIKSINDKIRAWKLHQRTDLSLADIIIKISPIVQGWINYYGRFYRSALYFIASRIEGVMVKWAKKKFKRFKTSYKKTREWLTKIAKGNPEMFVMWNLSNKVIG